jgi:hypothetical protein
MATPDYALRGQPFNDTATATGTNKDVAFGAQPFIVAGGSGTGGTGGGGGAANRPVVFVCT